jgi:NADH:ubiquinone oxidoreductase subunit D
MNEMTESLNIMNQVVNKLTKFKKIGTKKNNSNINPHMLIKYLYPKS